MITSFLNVAFLIWIPHTPILTDTLTVRSAAARAS
jgi:hypothetical protein